MMTHSKIFYFVPVLTNSELNKAFCLTDNPSEFSVLIYYGLHSTRYSTQCGAAQEVLCFFVCLFLLLVRINRIIILQLFLSPLSTPDSMHVYHH